MEKEAAETRYWLELCEADIGDAQERQWLLQESGELLAIFTSIGKTRKAARVGGGAEGQGRRGGRVSTIQRNDDLEAYKVAFEAAMRIFELAKSFPAEERLSLTDQIRRASG